jgi:hypothetical protein
MLPVLAVPGKPA